MCLLHKSWSHSECCSMLPSGTYAYRASSVPHTALAASKRSCEISACRMV